MNYEGGIANMKVKVLIMVFVLCIPFLPIVNPVKNIVCLYDEC